MRELRQQAGLADPRLTGHQRETALAAPRARERLVQPSARRLPPREGTTPNRREARRQRQAGRGRRSDAEVLTPQPRRQLARRRRRSKSQLARQPSREISVGAQRGRTITRSRQRQHHLALSRLVQRIPRGQQAGPPQRRAHFPGRRRRAHERNRRVRSFGRMPGAQLQHPLLVEALQHLAAAQRERLLAPARTDQLGERMQINPQALPAQLHGLARRPHMHGPRTERPTQLAERGPQARTGTRVEHVRPQPGRDLGTRMLTREGGKPAEHKARGSPRRHTGTRHPRIDLETTEQTNAQHRRKA